LGVEGIEAEDASGLMLVLGVAGDQHKVLLGKQENGRGGRYARLAEAGQSLLVDFDAEVPGTASGWVNDLVVDISQDEVAEVEIIHPDGERVKVFRLSADDSDFTLEGLPEGREKQSSWALNSLGSLLASLRLESVQAIDDLDWGQATRLRLLTFDGLVVSVATVSVDETHWVSVEASVFQAGDNADQAASDDETAAVERAANLNARTAGWAYAIPAYKHEAMLKRMEDLLKQPEAEQAESTGAESQ
jgi:hypothetical protein